jgi:peptidoglycan/LPS O-acetylase OafA/YrhL
MKIHKCKKALKIITIEFRMGRLKELDALRGIAALFVVLFHYSGISGIDNWFLKLGVTGVDLFFLISGYVILLTLEKTETGRDFVISRLSRLYPSFIVMIITTTALIYFLNRASMPSVREFSLNLTMMQPVFRVKNIDDSYWTLTVEMQFYILMLFIFLTGKLKYIESIGLAILAFIIVYYLLTATFFESSKLYIIPRSYFPLISHFQLFLAGITFYKMKTVGMTLYRYTIIAVCSLFTFYLYDKSGRSHFFIDLLPYATMIAIYMSVFYFLILEKLKFLKAKVLIFLGGISYCVYLLHQEAGKVMYNYFAKVLAFNSYATILMIFMLVLLVSSIVTYFIEKPSIAYLRSKFINSNKVGLVSASVSKA